MLLLEAEDGQYGLLHATIIVSQVSTLGFHCEISLMVGHLKSTVDF